MNNPSFQCRELNDNKLVRKRKHKSYKDAAYDKRLIESEHNNKFDGQKFSQRAFSFEFFVCKAIEHDQAIEGKAR